MPRIFTSAIRERGRFYYCYFKDKGTERFNSSQKKEMVDMGIHTKAVKFTVHILNHCAVCQLTPLANSWASLS